MEWIILAAIVLSSLVMKHSTGTETGYTDKFRPVENEKTKIQN